MKNETGAIYVASPLDYETRKSVSCFFKFKFRHFFLCRKSIIVSAFVAKLFQLSLKLYSSGIIFQAE